jgi:hypothetical protein
VVSRDVEVVPHVLDVISVVNDHVLDHQDKDYRIVFDKRVIMQEYST